MSKKPAIIKMRKAQDIDVPIDVIGIKNKKGESVFKQPTADERERAILKKENDEQKAKETARENKRSDFKKEREKKTEAKKTAEAKKVEAEKVEAAKAAAEEQARAAAADAARQVQPIAPNEKEVVITTYKYTNNEELIKFISEKKPDVIGLTIMTDEDYTKISGGENDNKYKDIKNDNYDVIETQILQIKGKDETEENKNKNKYIRNIIIYNNKKLGGITNMPDNWNKLAEDGTDNTESNPTLPYVRDMGKRDKKTTDIPFSMIFTDKGYILILINDLIDDITMTKTISFFSKALTHYLESKKEKEKEKEKDTDSFKLNSSKIFVFGHFNKDKSDTLKDKTELNFNEKFTLTNAVKTSDDNSFIYGEISATKEDNKENKDMASFTTDDTKIIEGGADNDKYKPITINWVRHAESIANLIDIEITKTPDMYKPENKKDYEGYRTYREAFIEDEGKNYEPFKDQIKTNIKKLKESENFKEICKKDKKDKMCEDSERMVKFIDNTGAMIKFNDLETKKEELKNKKEELEKNKKEGEKLTEEEENTLNEKLPKTPGTWMFTPTLSYAGVIQSLEFGKTYLNLITGKSDIANSPKQQYDRICCSGSVRTIMTMLISLISANRDDLIIAPAPAEPVAPVAPAQTEVFIYPYITEALNGGKFIDADLSNEAIDPKLIGEIVKTIVAWLTTTLVLVVDDQTLKTKYLEGITIAPAEPAQAPAEQAQAQAPDNKVSFTITKTGEGAAKIITINFNEYAKLGDKRPPSDTKKFIDFLKGGEKSVIEGGAEGDVKTLIKKFEGMNKPSITPPPSAVTAAPVPVATNNAAPAVPLPAAPVAPVTAAPVPAVTATTTNTDSAQPATAVVTEPKPLKILAFSHGLNINSRRFANEPSVDENTPFPNNCSLWEETFKFNPILKDYYPYGITTYKKKKNSVPVVIQNKFDYDENGKLKPDFIAPNAFKGSDVRKDNLITAVNETANFTNNNFGALKADTLRYAVNKILWTGNGSTEKGKGWTWPGVATQGGGKRINRKVYYKNKKYTRRKNMFKKSISKSKGKSKGKSSLRRRRRNRLANSKKTKKHYRIKKAKYTKRA